MAFPDDNKKSVAASDDMRDFLNMNKPANPELQKDSVEMPLAGQLPPDLPFLDSLEETPEDIEPTIQLAPAEHPQRPLGAEAPSEDTSFIGQVIGPATERGNEAYAFVLWFVKAVLPYVVIFAIGLGLYFFYFSDFSISEFFNSDKLTLQEVGDNTNEDLEQLKEDQESEYLEWMGQFFFAVNDQEIVSMDADVSGNGLTNFEKYLLNLNPKVYSTRGNDVGDGALVLDNINPWTGKPFTDEQKQLIDKYINKELISNRITAAALTRGVTRFAEYVNPDSPYYIEPDVLRDIQQNNPSISSPELASNQSAYEASQQSQSVNLNPETDINEDIPGKLEIPANNISVPLIWTKNVSDFDKDLKNGVVHYPGTAMPGQIGTSYISGHSSGYVWDRSPYKQIFAILGQVKDGTSFTITVTQKNGKLTKYHYTVERRGEFAANDQAQFISTADSVVALSTCWPVGTTARRLVLFAKLTQTERQ